MVLSQSLAGCGGQDSPSPAAHSTQFLFYFFILSSPSSTSISMPLHIKSPRPERPPKRSFDGDCESAPASKRQRLPPTPPTPDNLNQLHPPSHPQSIALTPPETAKSNTRTLNKPDPVSTRRVDNWFAERPPPRPSSAPPQTPARETPANGNLGEYQGPTFAAIPQMSQSQSQGQSFGRGSVASAQSSRPGTSSPDYRSVLYNNGIQIDHIGQKIPKALRDFLDEDILKGRPSRLSLEDIAETVNTAVDIADGSEGKVYDLLGTAMFPIKRRAIGRGGNTAWNFDPLPRKHVYPLPLATPKPDIHCGYPTGPRTAWSREENAVIDHQAARRFTQPAKDNCLPFLVSELKSEANGGTLWHAENQVAGSGASCVNSMLWLLKEAYRTQAPSTLDSIAFSACVSHREAIFHVHFYSPEDDMYYMSWIATFETMRHVQRCNHVVENIVGYGLGARQTKIRQALAQLLPFPKHWKTSRPASAQASQMADEDASPNKNQRTE